MGTSSRTFGFGGMMAKRITKEIIDFDGSEGVKAEREVKLKIVRP